jgi:hypothetical protein
LDAQQKPKVATQPPSTLPRGGTREHFVLAMITSQFPVSCWLSRLNLKLGGVAQMHFFWKVAMIPKDLTALFRKKALSYYFFG